MKNWGCNKKISKIFFLFSFAYFVSLSAMENPARKLPLVFDRNVLYPIKTITIFDPQKEVIAHRPWSDVVPESLMIMPDNKGILMGRRGKVVSSSFEKKDNDELEVLIEHARVTHSPLIAATQKEDGSLLIVSAGNYKDQENNKQMGEYIIYSSLRRFSATHKVDWPIQAISLDRTGTTLAIAGLGSVMIIDFIDNRSTIAHFKTKLSKDNWIVDIAINSEGNRVIAVGSKKGIEWMHLSHDYKDGSTINSKTFQEAALAEKNISIMNLKTIKEAVISEDNIQNIYYPNREEWFYITRDGRAKIFTMDFLLEDTDPLKTIPFIDSSSYDLVIGDPSEQIATAHWTNNLQFSENKHKKIEIHRKRKNNNYIEKFILEASNLEEYYFYITSQGQWKVGDGYLLKVALRERHVVAIGSDGKMRVWQLPEKSIYEQLNKEQEIVQKTTEEKVEIQAVSRHISNQISDSGKKRNSVKIFSFSNPSSSAEAEDKNKKSSSSVGDLLDNLKRISKSTSNSRSGSPVRNIKDTKEQPKNLLLKTTSPDPDHIKYSPRSGSAPLIKLRESDEKKNEEKK